jgi:hypothetical protein
MLIFLRFLDKPSFAKNFLSAKSEIKELTCVPVSRG